jgi:hypothetical protein
MRRLAQWKVPIRLAATVIFVAAGLYGCSTAFWPGEPKEAAAPEASTLLAGPTDTATGGPLTGATLSDRLLDADDGANQTQERALAGQAYQATSNSLTPPVSEVPVFPYDEEYADPLSLFPARSAAGDGGDGQQDDAILEDLRRQTVDKHAQLAGIEASMQAIIGGRMDQFKALLTHLGKEAAASITLLFAGLQSVGKSHVYNTLTMLSLSLNSVETGTKAPIHFKLGYAEPGHERFVVDGVPVLRYEDISAVLERKFKTISGLSETEVVVEILAPFIAFPMDTIDLPGLMVSDANNSAAVQRMLSTYAHNPNIIFVGVLDASTDPESQVDDVLRTIREKVPEERRLYIVNKVNLFLDARNSGEELRIRIRKIIERFHCPEDNLPFLFAVPRPHNLVAISSMPPEKQSQTWAGLLAEAAKQHDPQVAEALRGFKAAGMRGTGYPADRIGVANFKRKAALMHVDSFRAKTDRFLTEVIDDSRAGLEQEEAQQSVPNWPSVASEAASEFCKQFEKAVTNGEAFWQRLVDIGGGEFEETEETMNQRTDQCVAALEAAEAAPPRAQPRYVQRQLLNEQRLVRSSKYRGKMMFSREVYNFQRWQLASYSKLTDDEIDRLKESPRRHGSWTELNAVPAAVSSIASRIFSRAMLRKQTGRLLCTAMRLSRAALWVMQAERPPQDPMRIMLSLPKVQAFYNEQLLGYFKSVRAKSVAWTERLIGQIFDAEITDRDLPMHRILLQNTFADLRHGWPEVTREMATLPSVGRGNVEEAAAGFYQTVSELALIHFSERNMRLAEMVRAHHEMEWIEIVQSLTMGEIRKSLADPLGQNFQRYGLDQGMLVASKIAAQKLALKRTVQEGAGRISTAFPKLLQALESFDPFEAKFTATGGAASATETSGAANATSEPLTENPPAQHPQRTKVSKLPPRIPGTRPS